MSWLVKCDYHIAMTNPTFQEAFDTWKAAEEAARAADKLLAAAWELHLRGGGPAVTVEMQEDAARLRARASHLLTEVLAALHRSGSPR